MSRHLRTAVRTVLAAVLLLAPVAAATATTDPSPAATAEAPTTPTASRSVHRALTALEREHGARLGVVAVDTGTGERVAYRGGARFPFASTNKTFIAAATLDRTSAAGLDEVVHYTRADLLDYAPITSEHVDDGMTVRELIDAALRFSDNTAANLLVERLGGPDVVQAWLRSIGDRRTRVDRLEPELNEARPGDPRDTTTPAQFAADLRGVVLGRTLGVADRTVLRDLMLACTTGAGAVRAGVDPAWPVADKTGTAEYGVRNDVAVVYPIGRAPIVVVTFSRHATPEAAPDDALLAQATRIVVRALSD